MDKKLKILRCMEYDKPISIQALQAKSGIKNVRIFAVHLDMLSFDGYLGKDSNNMIQLNNFSSVEMYIFRRARRRTANLVTILTLIFAIIGVLLQIPAFGEWVSQLFS